MKKLHWGAWAFIVIICLQACRKETPAVVEAAPTEDSVNVTVCDSDTIIEDAPPAAADGLFADFIYDFMRRKQFQLSRIAFPLPVNTNGKEKRIAREAWKFDHLFAHQDIYTIIYDNPKALQADKDTTQTHVKVEMIKFKEGTICQYIFNKQRGQWMLTAIDEHSLSGTTDKDFYTFFHKFATNTDFQQSHISNPFDFKTYDYDSFQELEGILDAAQWVDYRPEMPTNLMVNIRYGKAQPQSKFRALAIISISAGMGCTMEFRHRSKGWMRTRLEN